MDVRKVKDKAAELFAKGKFAKAAETYEELVRADPKDTQVRVRLGDAHAKAGDRAKAIAAYQAAAETYARDGFLPRAIAACKLILDLDPKHSATQAVLADFYARKTGRTEMAKPPAKPPPRPPEPERKTPVAPTIPDTGNVKFPDDGAEEVSLELDVGTAGEIAAERWKAPSAGDAAGATVDIDIEAEAPVELGRGPPVPAQSPRGPTAVVSTGAAPARPPPIPAEARAEVSSPAPFPRRPNELGRGRAPAAKAREPAFAAVELSDDAPMAIDGRAVPAATDRPSGEVEEPAPRGPAGRGPPSAVAPAPAGPSSPQRPNEFGSGRVPAVPVAGGAAKGWFAGPAGTADDFDELTLDEAGDAASSPAASPQGSNDLGPSRAPPPAPARSLPEIPLFSELPPDAFVALTTRCDLRRFAPGEVILAEGTIGDSYFILSGGRVRVFKTEPDGSETVLAQLGEGAFFGEMALLSGAPRGASVAATEEAEALEIRAEVLDELSRQFPSFALSLKRFCRQRLLSNVMSTSALFRSFTKAERRRLVEKFRMREVPAGTAVLREGTPTDGLYVVMSGEMEVQKTQDGRTVALATLREGELFGEISLLTKRPATATVSAKKATTVLRLPREEFDELISAYPQVLALMSELSDERLRAQEAVLAGKLACDEEGLILV